MLRPADSITDGRGALAPRISGQGTRNLQPLLARHSTDLLDHLRGVPREVTLENLKDAARVLQRRVGERVAGGVSLIVPAACINIALALRVVAREEPVQVFGVAECLVDQGGGIGVGHHIVVKVCLRLKHIADQCA